MPPIASIAGRGDVSVNQVLKRYLGTHPQMADAAISKLLNWLEETGVAV